MIYESSYWKQPLLKSADKLEKRKSQSRWTEATFASVERDLMLGFFSVRKLIEAGKVDPQMRDRVVRVREYARLPGTRVNRFTRHELWEAFDLKSPRDANVALHHLCDQFIHSYVFQCSFEDSRNWEGVFLSSDYRRRQSLLWIGVSELIRNLRLVGSSTLEEIGWKYDSAVDEWVAFRVQDKSASNS